MKIKAYINAIGLAVIVSSPALGSVDGYEIISSESALNTASFKQKIVYCSYPKKALGAGWAVLDNTNAILPGQALSFQPSWDGSSWLVNAKSLGAQASTWKLKVWVICAETTPENTK